MKLYIFLLLPFAFGCSKESEQCQTYYLLTESNEKEARYKCQGLANNYPQYNTVSKVLIGCLTSKEFSDAKSATTSVTKNMCSGVPFTVRQSVVR